MATRPWNIGDIDWRTWVGKFFHEIVHPFCLKSSSPLDCILTEICTEMPIRVRSVFMLTAYMYIHRFGDSEFRGSNSYMNSHIYCLVNHSWFISVRCYITEGKSLAGLIMFLCQTGDKPLSKQISFQFSVAHVRRYVEVHNCCCCGDEPVVRMRIP